MTQAAPPASTDLVEEFHLNRSGIRGRLVRLGPALDAIIKRHDYPEPVAALLGETLVLAAALAAALKYEGVFTLQTRGDGPVSLMVADISSNGAMRAYAQFDKEKVSFAGVRSALLLGKGHLAFTVDSGENASERYQGIVELLGRDMAACVQTYFRSSEQIDSDVKVFSAHHETLGWQAGALLIQRMPEGGGYAANNNAPGGADANEERAENWERAKLFIATLKQDELLNADLPPHTLLHRLFHEEDLQLNGARALRDQCRCSRGKVAKVLTTIPPSEMEGLMIEGKVEVKCEFCGAAYDFDAEQIKQIEAGPGLRG